MTPGKAFFGPRIWAVAGALLLAAGGIELFLRAVVAGRLGGFPALRNPGLYADYFADDAHWLLAMRFRDDLNVPRRPHPVLGWFHSFDPDTYEHRDADLVGDRRPVLLFGDSFADCVPGVECFEEILNTSPEFSAQHYLLNYGVGGYGTDQILLLLQEVIDLYDDPLVVLSLMELDLDRVVLSFRSAPKPRFRLEQGELVLESPSLVADKRELPSPDVGSYLGRVVLNAPGFPLRWRRFLRGEERIQREKLELNAAILDRAIDELRARDVEFLALVFEPNLLGVSELHDPADWREEFLRGLFERRKVETLWTGDLIPRPGPGHPFDPALYFLEDNGHPTTLANRLVADAIAEFALR